MTLAAVARQGGGSHSTVSRVLDNTGHVSESARARFIAEEPIVRDSTAPARMTTA